MMVYNIEFYAYLPLASFSTNLIYIVWSLGWALGVSNTYIHYVEIILEKLELKQLLTLALTCKVLHVAVLEFMKV